eukprot:gene17575-biopygen18900
MLPAPAGARGRRACARGGGGRFTPNTGAHLAGEGGRRRRRGTAPPNAPSHRCAWSLARRAPFIIAGRAWGGAANVAVFCAVTAFCAGTARPLVKVREGVRPIVRKRCGHGAGIWLRAQGETAADASRTRPTR